ncbi:uncharacterized protein LOC119679244 isoform X2 [Teleopsis dalmanni]|uniref:uncharacterized protein LOC119679244 isoform X2 n=1 Tax=Teleopsis dalmanni TaxID=139649 RepID=UPI0018CD90F1|nr:uncharacterized protein LOC119679244 isoform X2 [Teleopsis dalmanni]
MSSRNRTNVTRLLEYWCEVQIQDSDRDKPFGTYIPDSYICECFPDNFREIKVMQNIPAFAFPCAYESESVQSYSFVLTTDDSKWRFGFCRQDPKTGTAMVLITFLPWHDTFLRFLTVLAEIRRTSRDEFRTFIAEAYNGGVPKPGSDLKLYYNGGQSTFVFERPLQFQLPSIPGNHNLNLYYNFVDPKNMIAVFAAMLAERRIIFTSRRLDKLSSCIQAANAFLYPMVWQHIFIPVLPMKLKDYLSAPMPYLIGVPKSVLDTMMPEELGEVVILNCDTKIFESPFDDVHELPTEIVSQLKKQLSHSSEHVGDRVSKIFLGVLVQLIGGYRDAVEFHDVGKCFNRKTFIESRPSHIRPFLEKMMELQIFQQFIDERLEMLNTGLGFSDEFEMETVRYAEKMKKRNRNLAFIRTVKDKTNPAVKSAVKSVKEGSRGVKTAYKDLKSKFRDITPPSNPHFRSHLASNSQHDRIDGYVGGKSVIGHHSAPSSPIFSKRTVAGCGSGSNLPSITAGGFQYASPEEINGATQSMRRTNPLAMSSSSSHIHSNGHTGSAINTSHHHNRLASSPTVSPASSLCSSEMNLSQELQNHPLFKSPIVDRSLKPSNSLELNHRISSLRTGGAPPARPPPPSAQALQSTMPNHNAMPHSYYNHPYTSQLAQRQQQQLRQEQQQRQQTPLQYILAHSHIDTKPPQMPRSLPTAQNHTPVHTSTPNKIITTDSIFDNPPDMQSPPVPPRRQCNYNSNVIATTAAAVHAGIHRLERNCWQDYADHSLIEQDALRSSSSSNNSTTSSSDSSASFVSASSTLSHQQSPNNIAKMPVPAPRLKKEKESIRSLQPHNRQAANSSPISSTQTGDSMKDLISLDDSRNASFDLEDFDPLNQNARPFPVSAVNNKKSTTLPAGASASMMTTLSPPTVKPPPLPTSLPPPMPPPDEDFELLRKYGLDQFTLTTTPSTSNTNNTNGTAAFATAGMSNWTTFD